MKIVKQNKYTKIKNKDKKEAKQQLEKYQKHYMLALNQNITLFIYLKKMEQNVITLNPFAVYLY